MTRVKCTPRLRRYIIKQVRLGITPITTVARNRHVPRRTIYYLLKQFKQEGFESLDPKPFVIGLLVTLASIITIVILYIKRN